MKIITRYIQYNNNLWMFRQNDETSGLNCTLKRFASHPEADFLVSEIFFDSACLLTKTKVADYCDANMKRGNMITLNYPTTQEFFELLLNLSTEGIPIFPLSGGWSYW